MSGWRNISAGAITNGQHRKIPDGCQEYMSATSDKAGGLRKREPLKAVKNGRRSKRHQLQLFEAFVFLLLVLDVLTHGSLIFADR